MIDFLDVCERAEQGPLMTERDFELKVFIPQLTEVVSAYGIRYDPEMPVPADDSAADRLYHAALDFLVRVGIYCQDTNRVIQFTEDEIRDAVRAAPGECLVGEGKDAGVFRVRKPDDGKMARCHVNWGTIHSSEKMAIDIMAANVAYPEAKAISISSVNTIRGMRVKAGSPVEVYAGIRAVNNARIVGKNHLKFKVTDGSKIFNAIAYNMGDYKERVRVGAPPIDLLYNVEENEWMGRVNIQLVVKAIH